MNNTISQSHTANRGAFTDIMPNILRHMVDNLDTPHMEIHKIMKLNKQFRALTYHLLKDSSNNGIKAQTKISADRIQQTLTGTEDNNRLVHEKIPALFERGVEEYGLREMKHMGFSFSPLSSTTTVSNQAISALLHAIANKGNLKNLDISINEFLLSTFIQDIIHILNHFQNESKNVYLYFNKNGLTAADMENLGPAFNESIAKFCLIDNAIGSAGIRNLAPHFQNTSISLLQLDNARIGNEGLQFLEENLPEGRLPETLEFLSLADNNIDHDGIPYLDRILPDNIKNINLSENKITNEGVQNIVTLLINKDIVKLFLCANKITFKNGGAEVLISALHNTAIRLLDLRNNISTIGRNNIQNRNNQDVGILFGKTKHTPAIMNFEKVYA